jgi:serine/threonine-protein kinase
LISVGSKIGGYEIVQELRAGGMATLFLARKVGAAGFARHVAIKVVHPHLAKDKGFVRMFLDEAILSARIQHPNVVHVEELGEVGGSYFLAMEYVRGCSLWELMRQLQSLRRGFAPELAAWIAMQIADGLHAAHETRGETGELLHVVHRDVSPQNVLLSYAGHVKVIDFGIAKARGRMQQSTAGGLKGKIGYMSPEQAFGRPVDRRADIYAVGVVLWEMLSMRRAFRADNDFALLEMVRNPQLAPPGTLVAGIPPALDRVVMTTLSADPAARPANAYDLRRMLLDAVPGAAGLDSSALSALLAGAMQGRIAEEKQTGPASLAGYTPRPPGRAFDVTTITPPDVLGVHTVSLAEFPSDLLESEDDAPSVGSGVLGGPVASLVHPSGTVPAVSRSAPGTAAAGRGKAGLAIALAATFATAGVGVFVYAIRGSSHRSQPTQAVRAAAALSASVPAQANAQPAIAPPVAPAAPAAAPPTPSPAPVPIAAQPPEPTAPQPTAAPPAPPPSTAVPAPEPPPAVVAEAPEHSAEHHTSVAAADAGATSADSRTHGHDHGSHAADATRHPANHTGGNGPIVDDPGF